MDRSSNRNRVRSWHGYRYLVRSRNRNLDSVGSWNRSRNLDGLDLSLHFLRSHHVGDNWLILDNFSGNRCFSCNRSCHTCDSGYRGSS